MCHEFSHQNLFFHHSLSENNPVGYRGGVPEVQNENDGGKALIEAALFKDSHG